ncbi:acetyl-coenzyme A transporter 1-like [Asterias amurensis]|uniref:acetyl-coenzyme A transporter 1-like n=1 Tax=Asterias amurensis TaxID=7602 RepID=UPI003AB5860A
MPSRKRSQKPDESPIINSQTTISNLTFRTDVTPSSLIDGSKDLDMGANGPGLKGDYKSIMLLLLLYVLQGIPLGLAGSIPLVLQSRKVSYSQQAVFSFVYWPFSVKLIWAPIVDSLFVPRFGRRKTWLVPTQYAIGFFMLFLSSHVSAILGDADEVDENSPPINVYFLTAVFFMLNFLAATQDIAVDGWALTMLSKRNVGYASTCNTVGQTAGYFLGNVVFLALESADFCNKYLRSEPKSHGLVTLPDFLFFWACVFLVTTTLIALLKHEKQGHFTENDELKCGVFDTYKQLYQLLKLPSIKAYMLFALTYKIGFAAADAVTGLKLIEGGVPKEKLALLAVPIVPLQILLPWVISKYTSGPRPLDILLKAFPIRLLIGGTVFFFIVWWTPSMKSDNGEFPLYYYVVIILVYTCYQIPLYSMFVASMAFNARISDPRIGGTYMTLLNTVQNLGGNWPSTLALWMVDFLTWKSCVGGTGSNLEMDCDNKVEVKACTDAGGHCVTDIDGYYIELIACLIIGFTWLCLRSEKVRKLQDLKEEDWKCPATQ